MPPYTDDDWKLSCGCVAVLVVLMALVAIFRFFVLTPTGWGF